MVRSDARVCIGARGMGRRTFIATSAGALGAPSIVRAQGRNGVALVIGNSKYQWEATLPNVRRDVPDVARHFEAMGLKTEIQENLDRNGLRAVEAKFKAMAHGAGLAALYFAGHGVYIGNTSYVVPVDADLTDPNSEKSLISGGNLARVIREAARSLLVLDSCRNNPAGGWVQRVSEERTTVMPGDDLPGNSNNILRDYPNSLRLLSTAPGRIALDGPPGQNSPFAAAFMRQLDGDSVDLQKLPGALRRDLLLATGGQQFLWDVNAYKQPSLVAGAHQAGATTGSSSVADIVEFDKAYAFAQQHDIPLPAGLVGIHSGKGGVNGQKVGSFVFDTKNDGQRVLLVLAVDGDGTANTVLAGKKKGGLPYWSLVHGTVTGDRLGNNTVASEHYVFDWRDANSGSGSMIASTGKNKNSYKFSFYRLDG
jgi:hypothetical protein